jgi:hypothetical protein
VSLPDTFAAKVREQTGCQVWIGATNNKGYGVLSLDGARHLAHRIAYESAYGPIPDGMVVDHLCRVRNCVNPLHLEVVTSGENQRRGRVAGGLQVGDICKNEHLIVTESDIYERASGVRECRICRAAGNRRDELGRRRPTSQRRAESVARDLDAVARLADTG